MMINRVKEVRTDMTEEKIRPGWRHEEKYRIAMEDLKEVA